ncbi:MAG TPA: ATP-dependent Clp protease proteolytic subunit [Ignavibacteria bacterium]|nr:ATP-dependent Clp protease proteolytic subunit [Ignavibacteria bacterium]
MIKKEIEVEDLSKEKSTEIVEEINNLNSQKGQQTLNLKLHSTIGDLENAMAIIELIHGSENVDLAINVSGEINEAGTILTAAGKPGERVASQFASFTLNESPYPEGSKEKDLNISDKNIFETLTQLTGKKKLILECIINGKAIDTNQARKLKIIDRVEKFKSKYRKRNSRTKKAEPVIKAT